MNARDLVIKPSNVAFATALCPRGKTRAPDGADAGYFKDLTKGNALRTKVNEDTNAVDENVPLTTQIDDVSLDASKNNALLLLPQIESFNVKFTAQQFGEYFSSSMGQEHLAKNLSSKDTNTIVKKDTQPLKVHQRDAAQKGHLKSSENSTNMHQTIDKKTLQHSSKTPIDLPQITPQKQNFEGAPQPLLPFTLLQTHTVSLQNQTILISNLPHVTRIEIDQTKRNSAGVLTSLELVLEPAELGRITAKLSHDDGKVTLILSAEHRYVADELLRDAGLLMRVLGDHIPSLDTMTVLVQTEAQQAETGRNQAFPDFAARHGNQQKQNGGFIPSGFQSVELDCEARIVADATTSSRVYV